jgi:hypothetical protein
MLAFQMGQNRRSSSQPLDPIPLVFVTVGQVPASCNIARPSLALTRSAVVFSSGLPAIDLLIRVSESSDNQAFRPNC